MRYLGCIFVLVLLYSCHSLKPISSDYQVIPGKQVGWLKIGADATSAFQKLGKADWGSAAMGKSLTVWTLKDSVTQQPFQLRLFTTMNMGIENFRRIRYIRMTSPGYRLASGIGVGSKLKEIQKEFSLKTDKTIKFKGENYTIMDTEIGIAFEFDKDNICRGLLVYPPDRTADSSYIPMYEERQNK